MPKTRRKGIVAQLAKALFIGKNIMQSDLVSYAALEPTVAQIRVTVNSLMVHL